MWQADKGAYIEQKLFGASKKWNAMKHWRHIAQKVLNITSATMQSCIRQHCAGSAAACVDNDAGAQSIGASNCAATAAFCNDPAHGANARKYCPKTCSECTAEALSTDDDMLSLPELIMQSADTKPGHSGREVRPVYQIVAQRERTKSGLLGRG